MNQNAVLALCQLFIFYSTAIIDRVSFVDTLVKKNFQYLNMLCTLNLLRIAMYQDRSTYKKVEIVLRCGQRYTYRVLQTIQMKLILLCVWAEPAVLGSTKTALKFKYEI